MDLSIVVPYLGLLASGFGYTVFCWLAGALGAMALGLPIALLRMSPVRWLRIPAVLYIEAIRGTPLLLIAFLIYGGGPAFGLLLEPLPAGILALALHASAYFAEIYRVGFNAVPRGHVEAAASLGMSPVATFLRVQLPEALVAVTPSMVNALVVLSKETSILSIISVPDLTYEVQKMGIETFASFESLFALAIGYWALVSVISTLGAAFERRVTFHIHAARSQ
ncbi:polar amino acid transport system permease protein [Angulomicrobium tetraedrale]|uniref:Polar amino acid transport system permease protein n=1 Tax=Ancylobacter tetraedralis TaxID=217068 RepID=A0A839Z390_9HYPH|nr:amino acid ABC transporter permease [Ancylobacter tetraedralis]MBB3771174.1 polar amino acid transport system permease protein [Ancylobacter tetraedralis]